MIPFNEIPSVQFQKKMQPYARRIIEAQFPGSCIKELDEIGYKLSPSEILYLDQKLGIDRYLQLSGGQRLSLQEKYRTFGGYGYDDISLEYVNAPKSYHESEGEWTYCIANICFYAWANKEETDFIDWLLIDFMKLKLLGEEYEGIKRISTTCDHNIDGACNYIRIPTYLVDEAIMARGKKKLIRPPSPGHHHQPLVAARYHHLFGLVA
jgi:hypothetical protein